MNLLTYQTLIFLGTLSLFGDCTIFGRLEIDYCRENESIKIQLALVLDSTFSFQKHKLKFAMIFRDVIKEVNQKHPGSQYAFITFSEYANTSKPTDFQPEFGRGEGESGRENCYYVHVNLTTDSATIQNAVSTHETRYGEQNTAESSLTAVLFAVADKKLGWATDTIDPKDGKLIRKIVVLVTDEIATKQLANPGDRKPPKADGTDLCSNTLPPNNALIEKTLIKHEISVVGIFFNRTEKHNFNTPEYYAKVLGSMAIPYKQYDLVFENTKQITDDILSGVSGTVECVEEDPPAYNTLGL